MTAGPQSTAWLPALLRVGVRGGSTLWLRQAVHAVNTSEHTFRGTWDVLRWVESRGVGSRVAKTRTTPHVVPELPELQKPPSGLRAPSAVPSASGHCAPTRHWSQLSHLAIPVGVQGTTASAIVHLPPFTMRSRILQPGPPTVRSASSYTQLPAHALNSVPKYLSLFLLFGPISSFP